MKVTEIVEYKVNRFKSGHVFTYDDFDIPVDKGDAMMQALSRLVASGKIVRLSKGQFYKPVQSEFGILKPSEYQVVKDLLFENNRIVGYMTGVSVFNKLGLTTQISNTIQIGTNMDRKPRQRGKYTIRFIRQKNIIRKDNIYLLQLLDAIRFIKRIPDADINASCRRLLALIKELTAENKTHLGRYALKYNASTRALTGAMMDYLSVDEVANKLYVSLNPVTSYKLGIDNKTLPNAQRWRIV